MRAPKTMSQDSDDISASKNHIENVDCNQDDANENLQLFKIKKWNAVALWYWDLAIDNCAICRNHIMDLCIECHAETSTVENPDCSITWGACNHAFHKHCIARWLRSRNVCPLDNRSWEYSEQQQ